LLFIIVFWESSEMRNLQKNPQKHAITQHVYKSIKTFHIVCHKYGTWLHVSLNIESTKKKKQEGKNSYLILLDWFFLVFQFNARNIFCCWVMELKQSALSSNCLQISVWVIWDMTGWFAIWMGFLGHVNHILWCNWWDWNVVDRGRRKWKSAEELIEL
jgi:hypothetical protein